MKPDEKYQCSCKRTIDPKLFPDHWASCKDAYNFEKFKRHDYCVDQFSQFIRSVMVVDKESDKVAFVSTEKAINLALKDINLEGEIIEQYRRNKAKKIIPDVMVTLDTSSKSRPKVLEIDFENNVKSYLFDVRFTHTCSGRSDVLSLTHNIENFPKQFGRLLNYREKLKIAKYSNSLGMKLISKRFSPIVFDMAGGIGKYTKQLFEKKFERFPEIASRLKKDINYFKSLSWFLRVNSMNVARSNYAIYKEFLKLNNKSDD
jgi:hypothetical protein